MSSVDLPAGDATHRRSRRIMSFQEWCKLNSLSPRTGRKVIQSGDGPKVTQLSDRRIGVRVDHNDEWQERRIRPA